MFHYQLNQNTGCKVSSAVNMKRQPKRLSNRRRSERPFYLPRVYPGVRGFKTLFSLNPGVTRDSRVTPGLPLDSKTGHKLRLNSPIDRFSKKQHHQALLEAKYCPRVAAASEKHQNPCDLDLRLMTLKFNRLLEVLKVHVCAKSHQDENNTVRR